MPDPRDRWQPVRTAAVTTRNGAPEPGGYQWNPEDKARQQEARERLAAMRRLLAARMQNTIIYDDEAGEWREVTDA